MRGGKRGLRRAPGARFRDRPCAPASLLVDVAYQGALAPQHVKLTQVGRWEVVSYDIPLDGGVSAHLRAQRVQAGTWIDLHLSSTQAREGEQLREELVSTLRTVEVVEKAEGGR